MARLISKQCDELLKETSRSFFLTLKVLPKKSRSPIGMLYLLARLADTIADSEVGDANELVSALTEYNEFVQGRGETLPTMTHLASIQTNPAEARLLNNVEIVVAALSGFSQSDQNRIKTCLDIIVGGQTLDLTRFRLAESEGLVTLSDDAELDDYAYRVAGSVGEFWTHLSLDHHFSVGEEEVLLFERAVRFGKALQLINILRDIPEDLSLGRCYIPAVRLSEVELTPESLGDAENYERFQPLYDQYLDVAVAHLDAAVDYIGMIPYRQFRLRLACMLPVLIGQRTLQLLRAGNVLDGEQRIKVSRAEVKRFRNRTLLSLVSRRKSRRLLNELRRV